MTFTGAVPFHIISGFLGSGKTTFLQEIISQTGTERKTGIIMNEFAPANIDGAILKQSDGNWQLLEINNGSVFCVCLLGGFVESLKEFMDTYSPDIIILEASGLSDTTSVAEILSDPGLSGRLYLAANWCIVDAGNFIRSGKMVQRVQHQIRMADVVVINKTDLAGDHLQEIIQHVKQMNPFAEIMPATYCKIPFDLRKHTAPRDDQDLPAPMARPEVHSMVLKTTRSISEQNLEEFLAIWAPFAYRIKGFVKTDGPATLAVQCNPRQTEIRPVDYWPGPTELIAITDRFTLREWNRSFGELADQRKK